MLVASEKRPITLKRCVLEWQIYPVKITKQKVLNTAESVARAPYEFHVENVNRDGFTGFFGVVNI